MCVAARCYIFMIIFYNYIRISFFDVLDLSGSGIQLELRVEYIYLAIFYHDVYLQ